MAHNNLLLIANICDVLLYYAQNNIHNRAHQLINNKRRYSISEPYIDTDHFYINVHVGLIPKMISSKQIKYYFDKSPSKFTLYKLN